LSLTPGHRSWKHRSGAAVIRQFAEAIGAFIPAYPQIKHGARSAAHSDFQPKPAETALRGQADLSAGAQHQGFRVNLSEDEIAAVRRHA
jgi:hypothetical protein